MDKYFVKIGSTFMEVNSVVAIEIMPDYDGSFTTTFMLSGGHIVNGKSFSNQEEATNYAFEMLKTPKD